MLESKFYIYRHIRPDTNEVFYIGKGSNISRGNNQRMISKERSVWWKRIVALNNGNYKKEVIFECDNEKLCFEKEQEFIALYGRKDLGKGTLVNMTNGGDGATGIIITDKQKLNTSIRSSKKVIDVLSGKVYYNATVAAEENNIAYTQLITYLTGKGTNTSSFVYHSVYLEKGKQYCIDNLINQKWVNKRTSKVVINLKTDKEFVNAKEAAISINISPRYFRNMLNGTYPNKTDFQYKHPQKKWNRSRRQVQDIVSGFIYDSIPDAANAIGIHTTYLQGMLSGKKKNKTNLRYKDGL